MMRVKISPASIPSSGFEKFVISLMKLSLSLSGETAAAMALIPYIRTAKPRRMPPIFLRLFFFENIQKTTPMRATTPVSISVVKYLATPVPPRLLRQRTHPVTLVPRIAPRMTPIACLTFIIPEFTKPTVMTDVADDDWTTAVTPVPSRIALRVFPDSL